MNIKIKAKSERGINYKPVMLVLSFLENSSLEPIPDVEKSIWLKLSAANNGTDGLVDVTIGENDWEYHLYEECSYDFYEQWERKNTCYSIEHIKKMYPAYKIEEVLSGAAGSISNIGLHVSTEDASDALNDVWSDRELTVSTDNAKYVYKNFEWVLSDATK